MGGACGTYGRYRGLIEKPEGKGPLEVPGVDGRIILRWIFRKWDVWALAAFEGGKWGDRPRPRASDLRSSL
jgi:hypothetical protein